MVCKADKNLFLKRLLFRLKNLFYSLHVSFEFLENASGVKSTANFGNSSGLFLTKKSISQLVSKLEKTMVIPKL